jgi:hypothetical protein
MIESRIRFAVALATVVVMGGCAGTNSESTGGTGAAGGTGGITGTGGISGMGGAAGMGGASGMGGAAGEGGTGGVIPAREWGTAVLIEASDEDAAVPQVAFDPTGNAIAVWAQSDGSNGRIWASWYVPNQGWGTAEFVSPAMSTSGVPKVGVDSSGNAIAVWRQNAPTLFGAWANRYMPGTGWGTAEAIGAVDTSTGDFAIEVAVEPDGDAMSVWHQRDGMRADIWANRYASGGAWGTAELLESENGGTAKNPQVAVDANGNAIAVWQQNDGLVNFAAANRYTPGGGWGTAQSIDNAPGGSSSPQVASDPAGNAMALWSGAGIRANRYAVSGGWGTAEDIRGALGGPQGDQDVAVSPDGNAIAIWRQFDSTLTNVWANRYLPGSGWGTAELIETNDSGHVQHLQVAVDQNGNAVAVWEQSDGTRDSIWANRYTVGLGWGMAELIETEDLGDAERPQIAVDPDGNAIAVWYQDDGTHINVWANRLE